MLVRGFAQEGQLTLTVEDNGPGFAAAVSSGGVGLENTRARLERMYGQSQTLRLENRDGGGARVTVTIPARLLGPAL